ncbi:snRNA-activating protein complex subunit 4 isoform X1 [Syngnathus acus]|uniref:snRNA-activating protein complex subunit 4 isoform X1 n=1 Tax=Syngnathus acus TaxID=161584 RepID=UPI001885D83F|nr:snRNA-activating protein complex subunit 4 isoform X1 [Syngnathus acus]
MSLCEQRERIQQQVELLQRRLCASNDELLQVSSDDTDDESSFDTDQEAGQSTAGLLAERQKIETEIQNLEEFLGPQSTITVSGNDDDDDDSINSSSESELGLSNNVDSCLQMNLVYQQILEEKLKQLETLLSHNQRQQREALSQLSGPVRESSKEELASSSCPKQSNLFLGHFLKPYFKDKVTGLGPPANCDTKDRMMKMKGCLDSSKVKVKRWEGWQKTLLIDAVTRDSMKRLIQPKLSRMDYLSQKLTLSDISEDDKRQLKIQIENLEKDIKSIKEKKEEELVGNQYDDHDWQKIAKIDFEGLRETDDIRLFWQNVLHPAVNKTRWSADELQQLKEVSSRYKETNWHLIAQELGTGRTAFMCLQTFQRFISSSLKRGAWTPDEDQKLTQLVEKMRIGNFTPYTQISYFMEGRDISQLIYRWSSVLDPQLKKGPWSKEEDQLLLRAVKRHGEKSWWKIRLEVPGRTDGACRDRYLDCLKEGTKKGSFDSHEHQLLLQLLEKHGVGCWAKIAAEIPNRNDAQCLREWKKMMRRAKRRPSLDNPLTKKRRRLQKCKEEEEEKEEDSSQEDTDEDQIPYMDSNDEKEEEEEVEELVGNNKEEKQEEDHYLVPPMHEWVPPKESQEFSSPNTQLVTLEPAPGHHQSRPAHVRSTVVAKFGRSVVVGPPPRALSWEERHLDGGMMMISQEQLCSHLCNKCKNLNPRPKKGSRMTDTVMDYMLQAAVLPWVGNVLTPSQDTPTLADALGDKTALSSTLVFKLLLQAMMIDISGCKDVILKRGCEKQLQQPPRQRAPLPPPRSPQRRSGQISQLTSQQKPQRKSPGFKNPNTVAAMLRSTRARPPDAQPALIMRQAPPTLIHPQSHPSVFLLPTPPLLTMTPRAPPPFPVQSKTLPHLVPLLPRPPPPRICLLTSPPLSVRLVSSPLPVVPAQATLPLGSPPPNSSVVLSLARPTSTVTTDHANPIPEPQPTGKKRGREEDSGAGLPTDGGKRARKPTHKALELQASDAKKRRRGWHKSNTKEGGATQVTLLPWVQAPVRFAPASGCVQLLQSPPLVRRAPLAPLPSASGPSPVRSEVAALNVDPSLVFLESPAAVGDWLSGRGGVAVPTRMGVSLPYLPPCSSSLSALTSILAKKIQLTEKAAQLQKSYAQTQAMPSPLPDASSDQTESLLRALVKDRLGSNPAYVLLKARFLSMFALPALLATMQPVATATSPRTLPCDGKKVKTKENTRRRDVPKFACDGSGPPASHFSGIGTNGATQPRPSETISNQ